MGSKNDVSRCEISRVIRLCRVWDSGLMVLPQSWHRPRKASISIFESGIVGPSSPLLSKAAKLISIA